MTKPESSLSSLYKEVFLMIILSEIVKSKPVTCHRQAVEILNTYMRFLIIKIIINDHFSSVNINEFQI